MEKLWTSNFYDPKKVLKLPKALKIIANRRFSWPRKPPKIACSRLPPNETKKNLEPQSNFYQENLIFFNLLSNFYFQVPPFSAFFISFKSL
jgi:hypothetical protein